MITKADQATWNPWNRQKKIDRWVSLAHNFRVTSWRSESKKGRKEHEAEWRWTHRPSISPESESEWSFRWLMRLVQKSLQNLDDAYYTVVDSQNAEDKQLSDGLRTILINETRNWNVKFYISVRHLTLLARTSWHELPVCLNDAISSHPVRKHCRSSHGT